MMKRIFGRKAYTLIELVLAIALTGIIASMTGTFISYAIRMRNMSDAQTAMYMTSLRLHKAISSELEPSGKVYLYTKAPTSYSSVPADERVIYCTNGMLYAGNKKASKTALLPTTNGFDSYNDVKVESIKFRVVKVLGHLNADTEYSDNYYRCVQVTTTVSRGDWTYTHTSTIRFDEMELNSTQVMISTTETAFDNNKVRVPAFSDESKDFTVIRYTLN